MVDFVSFSDIRLARFLWLPLVLIIAPAVLAEKVPPFEAELFTGVAFQSDDIELQHLHDAAVARLQENLVPFTDNMQVLVEGGGYFNAWLETQPMGGEMFAKRNLQVGLNNQVIFMLTQREDGRLPGMVIAGDTARARGWDKSPPEAHVWMPETDMLADFEMFQGFCFPEPAWRIYHWMGRDRDYLKRLYSVLEDYDAYLWQTRDSNGDGVLETWCLWDTGEDASTRLETRLAPHRWPFEQPPGAEGMPSPENPDALSRYWFRQPTDPMPTADQMKVPFQSMDINEPLFYNGRRNNRSGQPQGLTYQRAIDAMENYGHYAEVTLLGQTLLPVLIDNDARFTQQLDPLTGAPSGQRPDGYGPMMLAALKSSVLFNLPTQTK